MAEQRHGTNLQKSKCHVPLFICNTIFFCYNTVYRFIPKSLKPKNPFKTLIVQNFHNLKPRQIKLSNSLWNCSYKIKFFINSSIYAKKLAWYTNFEKIHFAMGDENKINLAMKQTHLTNFFLLSSYNFLISTYQVSDKILVKAV